MSQTVGYHYMLLVCWGAGSACRRQWVIIICILLAGEPVARVADSGLSLYASCSLMNQ